MASQATSSPLTAKSSDPSSQQQQQPTASSSSAFHFVEGDDAELLAWEATSGKGKALNRLVRDTGVNSTTTTTTEGSSTLAASGHLVPGVTSDTPLHEVYLEKQESKSSSSQDEKEKTLSVPSHVAVQLETLPAIGEANGNKGMQNVYLPAQDLHMCISFVQRKVFAYILYIIGSVLTLGFLALIAGYWAPALYTKWVYETRAPPTLEELASKKKIRCSIKIPSEDATRQIVEPVTLPSPVPSSRVFTPNMLIPFAMPADAAHGTRRSLNRVDESEPISTLHVLNFRHTPLVWHAASSAWVHLPEWRDAACITSAPRPLDQPEVDLRRALFGRNIIQPKGQSLISLTVSEALHPFYLFSFIACALWFYDTYQIYAAVIIILSVVGITATVVQAKVSQEKLSKMSRYEVPVEVMRGNPKLHAATFRPSNEKDGSDQADASTWQTISSGELVPGDIVSASSLLTKSLPADMILINAATVVANEAMLTGESTPSTKTAIKPAMLSQLMEGRVTQQDIEKSMLWGGTVLLRAVPEDAQDAEVRALVLSTGWSSTKGSLVKMMLFPKPIDFKFYSDAFKFILILTIMACIGFIGSVVNFVNKGVSGGEIALRLIDLFTICIPPALPAALSIALTFALNRLKRQNIHCIAPQRISVAGKVSIAVFDKTGTLTEGGLDVRGVRLPSDEHINRLGELAENVADVQEEEHDVKMIEAMAVTHDVTVIDGEALGDPLETSMLAWTGWTVEETPRALEGIDVELGSKQPRAVCARSGASSTAILRKFDFNPSLRRMSVVTQGSSVEKAKIYVKGAPEALAPLCDPATIPEDYHAILHDATRKGLRVLAFAYKKVSLSYNGSQRLSRDFVESKLNFLGLLFFENKLKDSSAPVIEELQQALIPCKMCTGDAVNTAIAIARQCNLIASGQPVFVPRLPEPSQQQLSSTGGHSSRGGASHFHQPTELIWNDIDLPQGSEEGSETGLDPYSLTPRDPSLSLSQVGLALTGDVFSHLLKHASHETLSRLLVRAAVFARFSPELKAELIEQLQKLGHTVAFCGDGANDTGALKAADVGLSLSEAEASVAAPFTSSADSIASLTALIKEGRNALATQISMFLFMAIYAISEYYSVILLYGQATSFDNASYLFIDIFQVFCIAIAMSYGRPAKTLSKSRPMSRLITRRVMLSFFGSVTFLIIAQTVPYVVLHKQSWYVEPEVDPDDLTLDDQDSTVVAKTNFFTLIWAGIIWNIGPPHREPIYRNYLLMLAIIGLFAVTLAILFSNTDSNGLQLLYGFYQVPYSFLGIIFGVVLIQAVCIFTWELVLIERIARMMDGPLLKYRRYKLERKNKKRRGTGQEEVLEVEKKYRSVERALKLEEEQKRKMMQEKH